jgi:hypothetical protein
MVRDSADELLAKLSAIRNDPGSAAGREVLERALASKVGVLVAKAAEIVAAAEVGGLGEELAAAFFRFMPERPQLGPSAFESSAAARRGRNDEPSDRGCAAKTALAKALYTTGDTAGVDVFLRGVRHVQKEAPFTPRPFDAAAELRGTCALGLVRLGHRDALTEAADLLVDQAAAARVGGARALAYSGREEAALPLRVKLRAGDADAEVMGECFTALLSLTPAKGVPFVARFLDAGEGDVADAAALALGESRRAEAFDVLRAHWERASADPARRGPFLLALGLLRRPESIELLLSVVRDGTDPAAYDAIEALALYRHDPAVTPRVEQAVRERGSAALRAAFDRTLGGR